ncbi:hypothetical protein HKW90_01740 [Pseudomonas aeruginosa]|uniref:hypothetical protein n=1 Tax=Pseudomonas nitroreducens TaxID=46680 RepID=UPI00351D2AC9|nr:hypothetical protein [Pseudomonas aeruginosa]
MDTIGPNGMTIPAALMDECKKLIEAGQAIEAIRKYRAETGCGLQVARRALGLGV